AAAAPPRRGPSGPDA
nr:RecName: Full=Unknown protein from spot 1131 of 2D-PAGE of etiolated coleoptile [Zea mays]